MGRWLGKELKIIKGGRRTKTLYSLYFCLYVNFCNKKLKHLAGTSWWSNTESTQAMQETRAQLQSSVKFSYLPDN